MKKDDHLKGLANYLGPKHTDENGNLHFRARVIYKWTDKMQQDIADVTISQKHGDITTVSLNNAASFNKDKFVVHFSSEEQKFSQEADNTILIITGKDNRLHGNYSVEIIPER
jgi:hypothetical protein